MIKIRFVSFILASFILTAANAQAVTKTALIGFALDHCTTDSTRSPEVDRDITTARFDRIVLQISNVSHYHGTESMNSCHSPSETTYAWLRFDSSDENLESMLQKYDGKILATAAGNITLQAKVVTLSAEVKAIFTNPSAQAGFSATATYTNQEQLWSVANAAFPRQSDVCASVIKDFFHKWSPNFDQDLQTFFKTWHGPGQNIGWNWTISFITADGLKMPLTQYAQDSDYWVLWGANCTQSPNGRP